MADSKAAMKDILHRFHEKDISRKELKECFRRSLRYRYVKLFRSNIPFEMIKQTSPHMVRALFRRVEDIKNARCPALNKLSDQILQDEEIAFDYVDKSMQLPDQDAENIWIDAYMDQYFIS